VETVSIVVPTYRRTNPLRAALDSFFFLKFPRRRLEVIVVDDGGGDREVERVVRERQGSDVSLTLISQANAGAAAARNRGARVAQGDLLLFCDDDVLVEPDHLDQHLGTQRQYEGSLVNGVSRFAPGALSRLQATSFGRYRIELEHRFEAEADGRRMDETCVETSFVSARNLGLGRALFWELGGFDESFPYAGAEDQELSLRARRAGCLLLRNHGIRVLNNEPTITLRDFCLREERSAETAVVLARKLPEHAVRAIVAENGPVSRADAPALIVKKAAKSMLSVRPVLTWLKRIAERSQRAPVGEAVRRRLYQLVVGLHIFKGVRNGFRSAGSA